MKAESITDKGLSKGEVEIVKALFAANGQKTVDEIAGMIVKSNGEHPKAASLTTAISQLRARFKAGGKPFELKGRSLEPKHTGTRGRTAERVDLEDVEALLA